MFQRLTNTILPINGDGYEHVCFIVASRAKSHLLDWKNGLVVAFFPVFMRAASKTLYLETADGDDDGLRLLDPARREALFLLEANGTEVEKTFGATSLRSQLFLHGCKDCSCYVTMTAQDSHPTTELSLIDCPLSGTALLQGC